jgi:hypothetical protein
MAAETNSSVFNGLSFGVALASTASVSRDPERAARGEDKAMTNTTIRTMLAAAALVVAAGTASAQSYNAEIPMAFHVGSKTLAPGSYDVRVTQQGVGPLVIFYNRADNSAAVFSPGIREDAPKSWVAAGDPKLVFDCGNDSCSLRKMWNGSSSYAYAVPAPKKAAGELVAHRTDVITLTMIKAH